MLATENHTRSLTKRILAITLPLVGRQIEELGYTGRSSSLSLALLFRDFPIFIREANI